MECRHHRLAIPNEHSVREVEWVAMGACDIPRPATSVAAGDVDLFTVSRPSIDYADPIGDVELVIATSPATKDVRQTWSSSTLTAPAYSVSLGVPKSMTAPRGTSRPTRTRRVTGSARRYGDGDHQADEFVSRWCSFRARAAPGRGSGQATAVDAPGGTGGV